MSNKGKNDEEESEVSEAKRRKMKWKQGKTSGLFSYIIHP
jgi:hypothetical protein